MFSLDDYFIDKEIDFIKADIEGAEVAMLLGSSEIMQNKVSQTLICLYHKFDDEANIKNIMNLYGYQTAICAFGLQVKMIFKKLLLDRYYFMPKNEVFANEKPDIVVNFAAESHVDRSIENPEIFLQTNIIGTSVWRYISASRDRREGESCEKRYLLLN